MELLLFAGLLAGLICLLWRYNLTPQQFFYKVMKKLFKVEIKEWHREVPPTSPYAMFEKRARPAKQPVLLNLATSDGSGQVCHPSVVHIPGGLGRGGWKYWLAVTPYPYGNDRLENPEIFVSHDGVLWQIPDGLINPVVPAPANRVDHNSDPKLLFHENSLWMFFRETRRSMTPTVNALYLIKSADGINWSDKVLVMENNDGLDNISPAVIYKDNQFVMWTVESSGESFVIVRRTSTDCRDWSCPVQSTVTGLPEGRNPWHLEIVKDSDSYSMLLTSCSGPGGKDARLHYGYSHDGLDWSVSSFLFEKEFEFESGLQYKAALIKAPENPSIYNVWYSAMSRQNVWSIAYAVFSEKDMLL